MALVESSMVLIENKLTSKRAFQNLQIAICVYVYTSWVNGANDKYH